MKFTCEKYPLLCALSISSRAAVVKSPIALLEGLLLEVKNGNLKISGYDLKTGIITNIPVEEEKSGAIVVNAKLLCEIVRKMPGEEISFDVNSSSLVTIECARAKLEILGSPSSDYPELPVLEEEAKFEINESILKKMISQTNFAVSDNESRPIYTGALFETNENELTIAAVDGYRLALRREILRGGAVPDLSFVVPGSALREVERILSDGDETVNVMLGQKHIVFEIDDTTLISRRLEGEFLDYKNSVPSDAKYYLKVDKNDLISSLECVSLVISEKLKSPVRCIFEDGLVKLNSSTTVGKASYECIVIGDGEGLEIGFNDRYFIDALKAAPSENVVLELKSSTTPCVITPGDDSNSFLYMILPVRLRSEG